MTAINIAIVGGGSAAHIVSDGAVYHAMKDKALKSTNKVKVIPQANAVAGFTGSLQLTRALVAYCDSCSSFDEMADRFPGEWTRHRLVRFLCAYFSFRHRLISRFRPAMRRSYPISAFNIFFVGYSDRHQKMRAVSFSNMGASPVSPHEEKVFLMPGPSDRSLALGILPQERADPDRWSSALLAVMKLQREEFGSLNIGRFAIHTYITRSGISQRRIHQWPEDYDPAGRLSGETGSS